MISYDDIYIQNTSNRVSLLKLTGLQIKDIRGWLTDEMGGTVFEIKEIELENGTLIPVGGEHDIAYLMEETPKVLNLDEDTLERLLDEEDNRK